MKSPPSTTVLGIPEILRMICTFLDADALKRMATVNRLCHQTATSFLWHQLVVPVDWYKHDLTRLLVALDRYGPTVRHMALELSQGTRASPTHDSEKIQQQLDQVLARTPYLHALDLQLPAKMNSNIIATTVAKRLPRLNRLDTDLLYWNADDMRTLFESCLTLTHLSVHELTSNVMMAIADLTRQDRSGAKRLERFKCVHGRFEPGELVDFCAFFPDLVELSVPVQQFLTSKDLIGVALHCTRLEILNVNFCLGLASTGFQAIFSANPGLTELNLGMTDVRDQDIALVATHCPRLKSLILPFCGNVTHKSIKQIVRRCDRLEHLDISWCDRVMLSIFEDNDDGDDDGGDDDDDGKAEDKRNGDHNGSEETAITPIVASEEPVLPGSSSSLQPRKRHRPFWVCTRLKHLDISGIHTTYTGDTEDAPTAPNFLPAMYAQLAELRQLEFLNMSGLVFSLRLNPLAMEAFANDQLSHLETLDIKPMKERLPWFDLVAIGNLFPRLRDLRFKRRDIFMQEEELAIEKRRQVESKVGEEATSSEAGYTQSPSPGPSSGSGSSDNDSEGKTRHIVDATLRSGLQISLRLCSLTGDGDESDGEDEANAGGLFGMGIPFGFPPPGEDGEDSSGGLPGVAIDSNTE
ncbi:F-box and leucine-rich repeat protein 4 [Actinomortierella ambigua]|uniref:F-box and leucine-rich repeat protein 4 n=1 Tax=Actinomortierella ambigua TaxID=1343610 RepID=A0A9P6Q7B5_9FUNG|nr:F-box and leucine-rich repeat protein 4 [Actinomortierella ambigua]